MGRGDPSVCMYDVRIPVGRRDHVVCPNAVGFLCFLWPLFTCLCLCFWSPWFHFQDEGIHAILVERFKVKGQRCHVYAFVKADRPWPETMWQYPLSDQDHKEGKLVGDEAERGAVPMDVAHIPSPPSSSSSSHSLGWKPPAEIIRYQEILSWARIRTPIDTLSVSQLFVAINTG